MHQTSNKAMAQAGTAADAVIARSLRRAPAGTSPLLAWPLVCGHSVAQRTSAVSFAQGILQVQVPDAGWRAELRALAPRYLAVINRYAAERVQRIEFVLK
jgi:hypothetical protein